MKECAWREIMKSETSDRIEYGMVGVLVGDNHDGTSIHWYSERGLESEQSPGGEDITYHRDENGKIIGKTVETGMPVPSGCAYDPLSAEEEILQQEIKSASGLDLWKERAGAAANNADFGLREAPIRSTVKIIRDGRGFITQATALDGQIWSVRRFPGVYVATDRRTGMKYWYKRNGTKQIGSPFKIKVRKGAQDEEGVWCSIIYWLDGDGLITHYRMAGSLRRKKFYRGDFTSVGGLLVMK